MSIFSLLVIIRGFCCYYGFGWRFHLWETWIFCNSRLLGILVLRYLISGNIELFLLGN